MALTIPSSLILVIFFLIINTGMRKSKLTLREVLKCKYTHGTY